MAPHIGTYTKMHSRRPAQRDARDFHRGRDQKIWRGWAFNLLKISSSLACFGGAQDI